MHIGDHFGDGKDFRSNRFGGPSLWWRTSKHVGGELPSTLVEDFQALWWKDFRALWWRTSKHFVEGLTSTLVDFRSGPSNRHATGDLKRNSKLELISHT